MNRIKRRTLIVMMIAILLVLGFLIFLIRYEANGAEWAGFPSNDHTHTSGVLTDGAVYDRNDTLLLYTAEQQRRYHDDWTTRVANLHAVGDREGFIGGSAVDLFEKQLMGYSMVNGVYSLHGEGNNVHLTVDAALNNTALQALNGRAGCVAVMDYTSGELLVMVSTPAFDPAAPPAEPSYLNRFLNGIYTPGSIFKILTAQAALEQLPNIADYRYTCTAQQDYEGGAITCGTAHGELDLARALAVSCNCCFADLAQQLGGDTLAAYAEAAGLTTAPELHGSTLAAGRFTVAEAGTADLGWSGVGQYHDAVTPYAMLRYVSAIANGGKVAEPQLLKKVTTQAGIPTYINLFAEEERLLEEEIATRLTTMLANNVVITYGAERFPGLALCAKSGTAEVADGSAPHAWFTGFLEDEEHPYAFIVLVENGGDGSSVAGTVANQVLQACIAQE